MAKLTPLAHDSAGFKVLLRLHSVGGTTTLADLLDVMWGDFRTVPRFVDTAAKPLIQRGLIKTPARRITAGAIISITPEGRALLESHARSLVAPRQATPMNSHLNVERVRVREMRPGAFDYREIPSLMSGQRVPFKGGSGK